MQITKTHSRRWRLTCLEKTAMSSLNDSEEQTSPPATPGSRGVHVASSHFSKMRASRGNSGCLKQKNAMQTELRLGGEFSGVRSTPEPNGSRRWTTHVFFKAARYLLNFNKRSGNGLRDNFIERKTLEGYCIARHVRLASYVLFKCTCSKFEHVQVNHQNLYTTMSKYPSLFSI